MRVRWLPLVQSCLTVLFAQSADEVLRLQRQALADYRAGRLSESVQRLKEARDLLRNRRDDQAADGSQAVLDRVAKELAQEVGFAARMRPLQSNLSTPRLQAQDYCSGDASAAEMSADGRLLLTYSSNDQCICLFEVRSGRILFRMPSFSRAVFAPGDSSILLIGPNLAPLEISLATRAVKRSLDAPREVFWGEVPSLRTAPTGTVLEVDRSEQIESADFGLFSDQRSIWLHDRQLRRLLIWDLETGHYRVDSMTPASRAVDGSICEESFVDPQRQQTVCVMAQMPPNPDTEVRAYGPDGKSLLWKRSIAQAFLVPTADPHWLLVTSVPNTLLFIDRATGETVDSMLVDSEPNESVQNFCVSPDHSLVFVSLASRGDGARRGLLYSLPGKRLIRMGTQKVGSGSFLTSSKLLLGGVDGNPLLFDVQQNAWASDFMSPKSTISPLEMTLATETPLYGPPLGSSDFLVETVKIYGTQRAAGLSRWNLETGRMEAVKLPDQAEGCHRWTGGEAHLWLSCKAQPGRLILWDYRAGQSIRQIDIGDPAPSWVGIADGHLLASMKAACAGKTCYRLTSIDLVTGRISAGPILQNVDAFLSAPASPYVVSWNSGAGDTTPEIWDIRTWTKVASLPKQRSVTRIRFLNTSIAVLSGAVLEAYDLESGKRRWVSLPDSEDEFVEGLETSPDGKLYVLRNSKRIDEIDPNTGALVREVVPPDLAISDFGLIEGGRFIVSASKNRDHTVYEAQSGRKVLKLFGQQSGNWVVVDPVGRFDTGDLDATMPIHWVAPDDATRALPIQTFMRQYYTPRLLPPLLRGERLLELPSIAAVNRAQPSLKISRIESSATAGLAVDIAVEIEQGEYTSPGGRTGRQASGAMDLKLFRDGRLIEVRKGDLLQGKKKSTVLLRNVRLPAGGNGRTEFSAYAFNTDGVKSETTSRIHEWKAAVAPGRPKAYVLAIGVDVTPSAVDFSPLKYAAKDAQRLAADVGAKLERSGTWSKVETKVLVATAQYPSGASKDAIRRAFVALQKTMEPGDLLIAGFAGHGLTDSKGRYYIVPSDAGARRGVSLAATAISTDELTDWLRPIDVGEAVLLIDACHSGAAVDSGGFKPGPMGSSGLGQLAYDKRMRVLAASQASGVAIEAGDRAHGLLTYALLAEGLGKFLADEQPKDGKVTLGEWLAYAARRVPSLAGALPGGGAGRLASSGTTSTAPGTLQTPSLFDFRKRTDPDLVLGER